MAERRKTRPAAAGTSVIGGGFPVSVQTMWKRPLDGDLPGTARELERLASLGCGLCRFSVPDLEQAELFRRLCALTDMPLVADIHFDYKLALACLAENPPGGGLEGGQDGTGAPAKIRINPGNIGAVWKVREVVQAARDRGAAIRIGINGGSLPGSLRKEKDRAMAMVKAGQEELEILETLDFHNIVFSLKSSDLEDTVRANEIFAGVCDYPLHLGVTEAGSLIPGIVKSAAAFDRLLGQGIGDTLRVSLSDSPENEVLAGKEILKAAGFEVKGISIISCPRCGRCTFDPGYEFLEKVSAYCAGLDKTARVAVMGCIVNGPEEARSANLGISGAGREILVYKDAQLYKKVSPGEAWDVFREEIDRL